MSPAGTAERRELEAGQLEDLRRLLAELIPNNRFYTPRLAAAGIGPELPSLADFRRLPFTTKSELADDQRRHPPYGTNLTYPLDRYVRFNQTSGTSGNRPLRWLDTEDSWSWMLRGWIRVFEAAGVEASDLVFFPFSFGPFLGFWTAFDAAERLGCLVLPGGGMTSAARLRVLIDSGATVVCCTPTYAIRLAEVAAGEGIDLGAAAVTKIIVAGEPGGSVPVIRRRIAELWQGDRGRVEVLDHHGMTEVGPVSFPNRRHPGHLHVLESSYLAEVIDPESGEPVEPGRAGELVLTTLGRLGSPLLRYRTGDLVRLSARSPAELGHPERALEGGILARVDDMIVVRGVNLYPGAVEEVIRAEPGVAEFRIELHTETTLADIRVLIEPEPDAGDPVRLVRRLEQAFRVAFQMRIPVRTVGHGELPRFELKARRWVKVSAFPSAGGTGQGGAGE